MKVIIKRAAAILSAVCICLSLSINVLASTKEYSDTVNSGVRGEICDTLDGTGAIGYYADGNSYESLSVLSEDKLLSALRLLMTETHAYKSSYADSKNYADETDCQNGDKSIVLLYTSSVVRFSDFIGSGSIGWNREHVWPKSLGGFDNSGAGADLHHIRPDDVTTNAKRGNLKYGNVSGGSEAKGSTLVGGAVGGTYSSSYFEPLDSVKGDVARICLYVYARYGGELSKCSSITNVFESVDVLLEWCETDPVDTWEMGRNEVVGKIQGNRNVFIDYPEYAWMIFGREVPEDMVTPSGMAMKSDETTAETAAEVTTEALAETTIDAEISTDEITASATDERNHASTAPDADKGCASSCAIGIIMLIAPIAFVAKKKRD